jgi:hypothetical protein
MMRMKSRKRNGAYGRMATTGAANAFVLNITELQNTTTTASGLSPFDTLSGQISQIQEMVIYGEKRIAVDTISAFSSPPIQVTDTMNVQPAGGLTVNGIAVSSAGMTGPTGPAGSYTPANPSVWAGAGPTGTQDAIDRLANLLYTLNGGTPIP